MYLHGQLCIVVDKLDSTVWGVRRIHVWPRPFGFIVPQSIETNSAAL